jgi:hypothetical protein
MVMVWVMVWAMVWVMEDYTVTIMECTQGIMVVIMVAVISVVDFMGDVPCRIVIVKALTGDRKGQAIFHPGGIEM